jgi:tetratricopeptide (TPR) repeat protein
MCLPLLAEGEFALVKEQLEAAGKKPVLSKGNFVNETKLYFMLADMAVQQRDEAALRQYAPLAEETANRDGHRLFQAVAYRAWGVMKRLEGDYAEAETRLNQALELFEELETRWQIGRTLYELAELAMVRSRLAEARDYFSLALARFEEMGAIPDVERTRTTMESLN